VTTPLRQVHSAMMTALQKGLGEIGKAFRQYRGKLDKQGGK